MNNNFDLWFVEDGFKVFGDSQWVEKFKNKPIATIFEYLQSDREISDIGLDFLCLFAKEFIKQVELIDSVLLKANIKIELPKDQINFLLTSKPLCSGTEYIDVKWIEYHCILFEEWLYSTINEYDGSIEACLSSYIPDFNEADRTYFHLVETNNSEYPFGFLISYTTIVDKKVKHMPLSYALNEYKDDNKQLLHLLSTLFKASGKCDILSSLIENGQIFDPNYLKANEAYQLLKNSDFFNNCGIGFRFPSWWKSKNKIHTQANIGEKLNQGLSLKALLSVELSFVFDNENLTRAEIKRLLLEKEGLLNFKGKWIEINHNKLMKLIGDYDLLMDELGDGITFLDFVEMLRDSNSLINSNEDIVYKKGSWLNEFYNHKAKNLKPFELSNNFTGSLRKYQEQGVDWLNNMLTLGFGPCLADDMGLGKTVQILAILGTLIERNQLNTVLLIVPSSLIGNWIAEKNKFISILNMFVLDKTEKQLQEMDLSKKGVYLSTYKMVSLRESIYSRDWDLVILDEAQAIKNSNTKQAKVIKAINAKNRIAMTGTPIENSLLDLWSIFDFINPNLLGNKREFTKIIKKAKDNAQIYGSLRNIVEPFILRRLKTDKKIIKDLPKKIERDMYIPLSSRQVALYKSLINKVSKSLEDKDGIERKGLILSTILKSKQICNHPSQYLKLDTYKEIESGKFLALKELVEVIKEKHEKMLIFTQYKSIIDPLKQYLESLFGYEGLSIDGSVPPKVRSKRVEEFNSDTYYPFMILSIKAGGTGLNLTSANHVVHFDRWWNPSVENQATDRAFRIGQKKVVNVYKFICKKTIEDKINEIINSKKELSSRVIGETEDSTVSFVTKMNDKELKEFFSYAD
ncbi:MAG: DEAD/DEAH box helicase [Pleomorphochaeta sp.]